MRGSYYNETRHRLPLEFSLRPLSLPCLAGHLSRRVNVQHDHPQPDPVSQDPGQDLGLHALAALVGDFATLRTCLSLTNAFASSCRRAREADEGVGMDVDSSSWSSMLAEEVTYLRKPTFYNDHLNPTHPLVAAALKPIGLTAAEAEDLTSGNYDTRSGTCALLRAPSTSLDARWQLEDKQLLPMPAPMGFNEVMAVDIRDEGEEEMLIFTEQQCVVNEWLQPGIPAAESQPAAEPLHAASEPPADEPASKVPVKLQGHAADKVVDPYCSGCINLGRLQPLRADAKGYLPAGLPGRTPASLHGGCACCIFLCA